MATVRLIWFYIDFVVRWAALACFGLMALALLGATGMAAFGLWPWIDLNLGWNGTPLPLAGMYAQIGLTIFAVVLCFFLPSNARILRLEHSHRSFHVGMQDVARAYGMLHAADRGGVFQLSSEFDAVRERLAFARNHPDLGSLEPAVLEVAAQMSHVSRQLAEVYSDEKVTRARSFLEERQHEVERFNQQLDEAKAISTELSHWHHQVELEEAVAAAQLDRLRDGLQKVLPEFATRRRTLPTEAKVTPWPDAAE